MVEVEFFYYHFHGDVHPGSYDVDETTFFLRHTILLTTIK